MGREVNWTKNEDKFLRKHYPNVASSEIGKTLNRTKYSVNGRARYIGIKKNPSFVSNLRYIQKKDFDDCPLAWFICGFVSGEGCFTSTKQGNNLKFLFVIGLANDDKKILEDIKYYFGVGSIYEYKPRKKGEKGSVRYAVQSLPELVNVIIPFFDKFGFFSARKGRQYKVWKKQIFKSIKDRGLILPSEY